MTIARAVEKRVEKAHQHFVFWRAMRRFAREAPLAPRSFDPDVLSELVYGWGNEAWSAQHEFLEASLNAVREGEGPILECGSGLSTILIGVVAQTAGRTLWSFEHDANYAQRVQRMLDRYGLERVKLCVAPLRNYGDFDWYTPPVAMTGEQPFSLVVCDGPPGATRGGRYGLVPVMLDKLRGDCTILLDDGGREHERQIAARWCQMLGASQELVGAEKPFLRLKAGTAAGQKLA